VDALLAELAKLTLTEQTIFSERFLDAWPHWHRIIAMLSEKEKGRPRDNTERAADVVAMRHTLKNGKPTSFGEIARKFGIERDAAEKIYLREVKRVEEEKALHVLQAKALLAMMRREGASPGIISALEQCIS